MRILALSDLHHELSKPPCAPEVDFDVVVLAGDIAAPGRRAVKWARDTFASKPVVLVPGNHEFYGTEMADELESMRAAAAGTKVHVLARDVVVIEGMRFVGAMLWTDFALPMRMPDGSTASDVERALEAASKCMNDYRRIHVAADAKELPGWDAGRHLLTARDTLYMHRVDRHWLHQELAKPFDGPTVVVTHHGPSSGSVAPRYAANWATPAFVSDLPDEFFEVPVLWIHGHTHTRFDYRRGNCRILSEPRGYRMKDGSWENPGFNGRLVVEIGTE